MRGIRFPAVGVAAALCVLLWQWATVTHNYAGNWTALFCTGGARGAPASLGEDVYLFPGSHGFDGQFYHYLAHDPLLRDAAVFPYVDAPRLRARRILAPALAHLLALGRREWVDGALILVMAAFAGLGSYWSAVWAARRGLPAWAGLGFLLLPGTLIGVDRMVADVALGALAVGMMVYLDRGGWRLWTLLAAAVLVRETGLLLLAGWPIALLAGRQWRRAAVFALAAAPGAAWFLYVQSRTPGYAYPVRLTPLSALWRAVLTPASYPPELPLRDVVAVLDRLALAGVALAFVLALRWLWLERRSAGAAVWTAALFAAMGIFLQRDDHWGNVYDFGRVYTPLLALLALGYGGRGSVAGLAPALLMLPRIAAQWAPQLLGVARGLLT